MTKFYFTISPCILWSCIALVVFTLSPPLKAAEIAPRWEFIVPLPNVGFNKARINQTVTDTAGNCAISVSYWIDIPATQFTPHVVAPTIGQIIYLDSKGNAIGILQSREAYFSRVLQLTARGASIATYNDGNIGGENYRLSMLFKPIASTPVADVLVPSPSRDGTLVDPVAGGLKAIRQLVQEGITLRTKLPGGAPTDAGVLLTELPPSTRWVHALVDPLVEVSGSIPVPGKVIRYTAGALTTIRRPTGR